MCALYTYHEAFAFLNKSKILVAGQKRKHVHKTLREKTEALKDIENGLWNKEVAAKCNVPKNISTWAKNKDRILSSLEEGQNVKRQKLCGAAHEALDQAVFKWFFNIYSQGVPLTGAIIHEAASSYAKELTIENFKASDGWLCRWKERRNINFKKVSGE